MKQQEPTVIEKEELEKFNYICKSLINDNFEKMNVDVYFIWKIRKLKE